MESHAAYENFVRLQQLIQQACEQDAEAASAAVVFMHTELLHFQYDERWMVGYDVLHPYIAYRALLITMFDAYLGWPEDFRLVQSVSLYQDLLQPYEAVMWRSCSDPTMLEDLRTAQVWIKIGRDFQRSSAFDQAIHILYPLHQLPTPNVLSYEQAMSRYLLGIAYAELPIGKLLENLQRAKYFLSMVASSFM